MPQSRVAIQLEKVRQHLAALGAIRIQLRLAIKQFQPMRRVQVDGFEQMPPASDRQFCPRLSKREVYRQVAFLTLEEVTQVRQCCVHVAGCKRGKSSLSRFGDKPLLLGTAH